MGCRLPRRRLAPPAQSRVPSPPSPVRLDPVAAAVAVATSVAFAEPRRCLAGPSFLRPSRRRPPTPSRCRALLVVRSHRRRSARRAIAGPPWPHRTRLAAVPVRSAQAHTLMRTLRSRPRHHCTVLSNNSHTTPVALSMAIGPHPPHRTQLLPPRRPSQAHPQRFRHRHRGHRRATAAPVCVPPRAPPLRSRAVQPSIVGGHRTLVRSRHRPRLDPCRQGRPAPRNRAPGAVPPVSSWSPTQRRRRVRCALSFPALPVCHRSRRNSRSR
mmetsp:Transcript_8338/g.25832  ORF Transcript_8338/g.25832 Transcript_8338/m.25832 type:complete len:269 (+) Transcript_8338:2730-3536(+)